MARNQGSFTVVVKRSLRTIEKGRLSPTLAPPTPRGWAEGAGGRDMAVLSSSSHAEGTAAGEARRAAEKMFASRKPVGARVLPTIAKTTMSLEEAAVEPTLEPVAAASSEAFSAEILNSAPVYPQPDGAAAETTTAVPSAGRRATRRSEQSALPPGQRRLWSLPESCWPEAVRRAARRNRRRAIRAAARDGEPVQ